MSLDAQERMIIETRVASEGPSTGAAYLLWLFVGLLSGHRFYLGRPISAILQIISYFFLIGFLWIIVDAFLIPGMIQKKRDKIRERLTSEAIHRENQVQRRVDRFLESRPGRREPTFNDREWTDGGTA